MDTPGSPSSPKQQPAADGIPPERGLVLEDVQLWLAEQASESGSPAQGYRTLAEQDLRLAELYRLAMTGSDEPLNPVQALRSDGQVWVDVLLELSGPLKPLDPPTPADPLGRGGGGDEVLKASESPLAELLQVHTQAGRLVSGRAKAQDLPALAGLAQRIQAARPVAPELDRSVRSMHADPPALQPVFPPAGYDGAGVVIGVVDFGGCDFLHPYLRAAGGATRLLAIWDQTRSDASAPAPYGYGRQFSQARIDQAIAAATAAGNNEAAYADLQYRPEEKSHGTHVLSIAGGRGTWPGVAPAADLVYVDLGTPAPLAAEAQEWLGSSKNLVDAVQYIFTLAGSRPAVVNLSLGNYGGPHDGSSLAELAFDQLLAEQPGRAIVIAAGNSYTCGAHAFGSAASGGQVRLRWDVPTYAAASFPQRQELEIWYSKTASAELDIYSPPPPGSPNRALIGTARLDDTLVGRFNGGRELLLVTHREPPGDDEKHIEIFLDDRAPELLRGVWEFELRLLNSGGGPAACHAWIERNDRYRTQFAAGSSDPGYTLNSIGSAALPIVVGAYDPGATDLPLAGFSSAGPSRRPAANRKPELTAPGQDIWAAAALRPGLTAKSGTSMAAPHVAGLIALLYQAAAGLNPPRLLTIDELRSLLIETVQPGSVPGAAGSWDARQGYGRVDGLAALRKLTGI